MKVILLSDIKKIGKKGDIVEVKRGYAKNYLIPQSLAWEYNRHNLRLFQKRKRKEEELFAKQHKKAEGLADELSKLSLTIPQRVKNEEELFGSVTKANICEVLRKEGYNIKEENIILPDPIKKLGVFQVKVKLFPDVMGEVKVWVVKK